MISRKMQSYKILVFIFMLVLQMSSVTIPAAANGSSSTYSIPKILGSAHFCQCVEYILNRYFNGQPLSGNWPTAASMATSSYWSNTSRGNPPRSSQSQPSIDAIIIFQSGISGAGSAGHIGVIQSFSRGNNGWYIQMRSANWNNGTEIEYSCNNVSTTNPMFIGDNLIGTTNFSSITFWAVSNGGGGGGGNQAPNTPTNLNLSVISSSQINLSWQDNSNNEDGFKIELQNFNDGQWYQLATVGSNTTNYLHTGLSPNTPYRYRVQAFNSGGGSGFTNEAQATTSNSGNPNQAPDTPTNFTGTVISSSQINLSWEDRSNNEDGFRIELQNPSNGQWYFLTNVGSNITSYQHTGLAASTTYRYRVQAFNSAGGSGFTNELPLTTQPNSGPPAYSDGTLITTNGQGIYVVYKGVKFLIPSWPVFDASGYNRNNIITLDANTFNAVPLRPDGSLITTNGQGIYALYLNMKFLIPSWPVFDASSYSRDNIIGLPEPMFSAIPLKADGTLVSTPGQGIYVLYKYFKMLIPSWEVFDASGYSRANIINLPAAMFNAIPTTPEGTLITSEPSASFGIWVIYRGVKFPIPSWEVFDASGYSRANIISLPGPMFTAIPLRPDGTLITTGGQGIYAFYRSVKFLIPSWEIFDASGYDRNAVIGLPTPLFNAIPLIPDGTLVTTGGQGIYALYRGIRFLIPSWPVFDAAGYSRDNIIYLPTPMFNWINNNTNGILLQNQNTTTAWIMQDSKKRRFLTLDTLTAFGYSMQNAAIMPSAMLDSIPDGVILIFTDVITPNDDGTGSTIGTLSYALQNSTSGQTINLILPSGSVINVSQSLPRLLPGVKLIGVCTGQGPGISIRGQNTLTGIVLSGNNNIFGVVISGFKGPLVSTPGTGSKLSCVQIKK